MVGQPNRQEEGQTCTYNVSPFDHPIDPIDPIDPHRSERISALGASKMSAPDMQAQEQALRRSKKQAREKIASNALIQAAGTGESFEHLEGCLLISFVSGPRASKVKALTAPGT